ncbi:MAG: DUF167 domain-containing protein [Anaerolineales bacterium]
MRKFKLHNGKVGAAITVRVTPRARKSEFAGIMEDGTLRIRIQEPPVGGKANRALIAFLAKVLGVRASRIEIVAGETGLDKIVAVEAMSAEEVENRIQGWLDA